MKRGCAVEALTEAHIKYLWAAYKMGVLGEEFREGLGPQEFEAAVIDATRSLLKSGGDAFILSARKPVGMVVVTLCQAQAWPHAVWFPWATARNRIECSLRFLVMIKEKINAVVAARPEHVAFFHHMCKYGVIRRIGVGQGWYGSEDAVLFETVRR